MLEGLSDKQLSAVVEGEVPPQRGHERNRQSPVGEGLVGCGLWGAGRAWATFVKDLKGNKERRGLWGDCYLPLTWKGLPGDGCPPSGADILNLGQKAEAEMDRNPPPGRPVRVERCAPHHKRSSQVSLGRDAPWVPKMLFFS